MQDVYTPENYGAEAPTNRFILRTIHRAPFHRSSAAPADSSS